MKKLWVMVVLLCCMSATAAQEEWMEMANAAGGKILLLQGKCRSGREGRLVISTTPSGVNIHGCWYFFADMIHIAWDSGNTSSFSQDDFVYKRSRP